MRLFCLPLFLAFGLLAQTAQTWTSDNGNGTFTNPLFYDEFSDPDLIRVGGDFYLTGTTMHAMPGLPVLHSRDLVNWTFLTYAFERLDLGPAFRLAEGKDIYGQGIWAPSFRYHDGTFYIFSNINGQHTQIFRARDPRGPWSRSEMKRTLHDLSVLFDDDGRVYVIWGYRDIKFAQLTSDLTDFVPGTERTAIPSSSGMGEGCHFYKINGRYFITSAWFAGRMRMPCARAAKPEGPYEVNPEISADEDFALAEGYRLSGDLRQAPPFAVRPPNPASRGRMSLHQGGIVDTKSGQWWGFSMMDYNSVGRLTSLSPVTWHEGWPYFGLPGNLKRTPRTWIKPDTGSASHPSAPFQRSDEFSGPALNPLWQWNHLPDDSRWSLSERPGFLRFHSFAAPDFWHARNTLTQRAVGPRSTPTVELDAGAMAPGDVAGLALLNFPYAWIGVQRQAAGFVIRHFNQLTNQTSEEPLDSARVWLRAACDFLGEQATFAYSTDGKSFRPIGAEFPLIFQLRTFQGVRYSLFHYNTTGGPGGYVDFDRFSVHEPAARGLTQPIPVGHRISLSTQGRSLAVSNETLSAVTGAPTRFNVLNRRQGRVTLQAPGGRCVSIDERGQVRLKRGSPGNPETFQWIETPYGDLVLLSLATHRYLRVDPASHTVSATHPGPEPGPRDGSRFTWSK